MWSEVAALLRSQQKARDEAARIRTPGDLAKLLDPATNQTPALDLIDAELMRAAATPGGRLIVSIAPQQGKSTRISRAFPIWLLMRNPTRRIVIGSYGQALAIKHGRWIRNKITQHPELGISIAQGNSAVNDWTLDEHPGGVLSVGRGTATTGNPADVLILDDPIKDRMEADSVTIRDNVWEWWTDTLSTRLAPAAPVIVVLTRWHHDDIAGRLLAQRDGHRWRVVNIPAQADHNPAKGETDLLGRQPGEYMESARHWTDTDGVERPMTDEMWEQVKTQAGSRTWASLYQGRPTAVEGGMVKRSWWQWYDQPQWVELDDGSRRTVGMDQVLISADLTFKGDDHSDYVAIGVWGRRGPNAYLLDQVRGHFDFPETVRRFEAVYARWPDALLKVIEDKANGPAVIATLRQRIPGLVAEIPQGSKEARVAAVSPLIEAHGVWLPQPRLAPWVEAYVDEWAAFPNGTHDDQVDQSTQALNRLLVQPLLNELPDDLPDLVSDYSIIDY